MNYSSTATASPIQKQEVKLKTMGEGSNVKQRHQKMANALCLRSLDTTVRDIWNSAVSFLHTSFKI